MNEHLRRLSFRLPLTPLVRELPEQFLLFRVDGDHRLPRPLERFGLPVDVLELRIPIGMLSSLDCLARALQAVIVLLEQLRDRARACLVPLGSKIVGQPLRLFFDVGRTEYLRGPCAVSRRTSST